jgi:hypothetical protein
MEAGDWWYKWSNSRKKVNPRFCWINPKTETFYWGRTPTTNLMMCGDFKLRDVLSVIPDHVMDEGWRVAKGGKVTCKVDKVFYIMTIKAIDLQYDVILGTEIRDKYDLWYRGIIELTNKYRMYNVQLA